MSKFDTCARVVMTGSASYAWIALHRCVEANARLTGERFGSIFARLSVAHGFGRAPADWPDIGRMRLAVRQLQREREAWLTERKAREAARRADKRAGKRINDDVRLTEMRARQGGHIVPRVGCWGWRMRRLAGGR